MAFRYQILQATTQAKWLDKSSVNEPSIIRTDSYSQLASLTDTLWFFNMAIENVS